MCELLSLLQKVKLEEKQKAFLSTQHSSLQQNISPTSSSRCPWHTYPRWTRWPHQLVLYTSHRGLNTAPPTASISWSCVPLCGRFPMPWAVPQTILSQEVINACLLQRGQTASLLCGDWGKGTSSKWEVKRDEWVGKREAAPSFMPC